MTQIHRAGSLAEQPGIGDNQGMDSPQQEFSSESESCDPRCNPQALLDNPRWIRRAIFLVGATIAYNVAEAMVAVAFGIRDDSIALLGFGFDSLIEVSAAVLLLWRLLVQSRGQDDASVERAERFTHRFVGVTFLLLATYILTEAAIALLGTAQPEVSGMGILIAVLSLLIMPALAISKLRVARHINSGALAAEAKETIACSILSAILLFGLGAHALFGWWWMDPAAGLLMIPWLIKEGISGLKGESCCG